MAVHPCPEKHEFWHQLHAARDRLRAAIDRFAGVRVLAIGDFTLDEFIEGRVERISREAPVPIVRHERTREIPGGGANAVYNLTKLGARVSAIGTVGDDRPGKTLLRLFEEAGVDTTGIMTVPGRSTTTKSRISAHAHQSVLQQIVRLDRKDANPPDPTLHSQLADGIHARLRHVDAVLCSDYGEGTLAPPTIAAALKHPLAIVDSQNNLVRYRNATWFTPNLPEAEREVGYTISDEATLLQAGRDLLDTMAAQYVVITRGEAGMSLFGRDGTRDRIPIFNQAEVYDVTGAGDTVAATLTLALAVGASPWESTVLGNLAASIVVRHIGTATVTAAELQQGLSALLDRPDAIAI